MTDRLERLGDPPPDWLTGEALEKARARRLRFVRYPFKDLTSASTFNVKQGVVECSCCSDQCRCLELSQWRKERDEIVAQKPLFAKPTFETKVRVGPVVFFVYVDPGLAEDEYVFLQPRGKTPKRLARRAENDAQADCTCYSDPCRCDKLEGEPG